MRILASDPAGRFTEVSLEGVRLCNYVGADDVEGWAVILRTDDAGRLLIENGVILEETLHGRVEFRDIRDRADRSQPSRC